METFMSILNICVSAAIVVLVAISWRRYEQLSCLEQIGYSAMAILCAAIVMKAAYNLSMHEFGSDPFGILFRCAFVTYQLGNTVKHYRSNWHNGTAHC